MKLPLFILFVAFCSVASAQKFSINGQLSDTLQNPLPGATVLLLNRSDSSLVNFNSSDRNGFFEIRSISPGAYLLKITYIGYRPYLTPIETPPERQTLDLGKIKLQPVANELEAIEIAADRAPVTVKKDTIEFNAGAFKTNPNAVVEDLLKKLPGVEVDNEGNITAQGEQVKRVMVDGKNFFGTDPKLATRNLPADAIDKVQVFDKKSDQAAFTGIDDGEREKTINLELKAEKRNAVFGNSVAGAGTSERFQARLSLNKFSKGQQLSFLGMANNANEPGFSMGDYMNFSGSSRQMMRGGGGQVRMQANTNNAGGVPLNFGNRANGLMNTYAGGVNLNHEFKPGTEVNGSYFYNGLHHQLNQDLTRENFLENGNFTFNENSREDNRNSNHRFNSTLDHKIDSVNFLKFTTNVSVNETEGMQESESENLAPDQSLVSANQRQYSSYGFATALNSTLLYRHRFPKIGRSFTASLQVGVNKNESEGLLDAVNIFYGSEPEEDHIVQSNMQSTNNLMYSGTVTFTEPIGYRKYLEATYTYRENRNDVDRQVHDVSNGETTLNEVLSNHYNNHYQYHRAGVNFRIAESRYNLVAGTNFQNTSLAGTTDAGALMNRTFQNFLPSIRFNYDFSDTKRLRFDYETSVREPDIQQLQPVVDNSDPFNIYVGNENLRPEYSQSWRIHFNAFDPVGFISFFAVTDVDFTSHAIVNSQNIDDRFVRTITPVNVSRKLSVNNNINLGVPLRDRGMRFNVSLNLRNVNSVALLNDQENEIRQQVAGGSFQYSHRYKEILEVTLRMRLDHQKSQYEFGQPDQTFINRTYTAESNLNFLKHYAFAADFDYLVYQSMDEEFEQKIPLLNLSVSRFVFTNKSGEVKLAVNNLLDKALGVDQRSDINYLERVVTNSLGRYVMVSFTYSLNKQLNPASMRRGRGMMHIGG
jgi:outer membrane receptor protein involved in Fe transport